MRIDLNADLGEGDAHDHALLAVVTSANIAAGGHAGGGDLLRAAAAAAAAAEVAIGAHPSYPDRHSFGRVSRAASTTPRDLTATLIAQTRDVLAAATDAGAPLTHVKAHGALYHDAANAWWVAQAVLDAADDAAQASGRAVAVLGPPAGVLVERAHRAGIPYLSEGFVDRTYAPGGALTPRTHPNALHTDPGAALAQALDLARDHRVTAVDGTMIDLRVDSLCVHGDTPGAARLAAAVRTALTDAGLTVTAPDLGR